MNRTNFYGCAMPLGGMVMPMLDNEGTDRKEVILKNAFALNNQISKMKLEVTSIKAVDNAGQERLLIRYNPSGTLDINGLYSGECIKTKLITGLPDGEYEYFRFYLNPAVSKYYTSDGEVTPVYNECLDFEMVGGLIVSADSKPQLEMRFDLPRFKPTGFVKWLEESIVSLSKVRMRKVGFPSSI